VNGRQDDGCQRRFHQLPPIDADAEARPQQGLGRRGAEAEQDLRAHRAISASSQGRQARISIAPGLAWSRFLPRGTHLKCFTTLVT